MHHPNRSGLLPGVMLALLGACALGPPDMETSRVYQGVGPGQLYDRTVQVLQASDLRVTESDPDRGVIVAVGRYDQRNWAECPDSLAIREDRDEDQQQLVEVAEAAREVELTASVSDTSQGASLTLDPAFLTEPATEMATTEECATTGVLERRILDAVARPS